VDILKTTCVCFNSYQGGLIIIVIHLCILSTGRNRRTGGFRFPERDIWYLECVHGDLKLGTGRPWRI